MTAKLRDKKTCFRCRALRVSGEGANCRLGYTIDFSDGEFYHAAAGQRCPKPLTYTALCDAKLKDAEIHDDPQLCLLEGDAAWLPR